MFQFFGAAVLNFHHRVTISGLSIAAVLDGG